jgi:serine/threonine protein kinase
MYCKLLVFASKFIVIVEDSSIIPLNNSNPLALLTEYCGGGALDHYVRRHEVKRRQLLLFANDIIAGLAHLHAHGVVHRDLAARNILLTRKPRVLKGNIDVV